jgi:hypothetical protein
MATFPLYGGSVLLEFDEAKHVYTVQGETVLSVTGVAAPKPGLVWWAAKMAADHVLENLKPGVPLDELEILSLADGAKRAHNVISKKAASIGTLAHAACEQFAKAQLAFSRGEPAAYPEPPVNAQARASYETFVKWWTDHRIKIHDSERKVYSRTLKYAGTVDLFCEVDGVACIVDLKTSNQIYDDYLMQLAAYADARNEELVEQVYRSGWVVRLPKDGGPVESRHCDGNGLDKAFHAFRGLLDYYKWSKSL